MLSVHRAVGSLAHLRQRLIDGEARRLLPGGNSLNISRNGTTIARAANRIGRIGGRGCSRLLPSHASLIALPSAPSYPSPGFAGEGRQGKQERGGTAGSGVGALLHLAEHIVEVEAGGLLALRILPERLQVLPDKGLRRHQQEDVVDKPIVVRDRADVGAL